MSGCLLVDAGNSRLKWRWIKTDTSEHGSCANSELENSLPVSWRRREVPGRILVSAVSGHRFRPEFSRAVLDLWGIEVEFAQVAEAGFGLYNRYRDPAQLGVDRWLALIAAHATHPGCVVVVDAGTVITCDLILPGGDYPGGMLMPGLTTLEENFRARVPHLEVSGRDAVNFPANNTSDAIALGIRTATLAGIGQFIDNAAALAGEPPALLLTGGDGAWLADNGFPAAVVYENLVLDGLKTVAEQT